MNWPWASRTWLGLGLGLGPNPNANPNPNPNPSPSPSPNPNPSPNSNANPNPDPNPNASPHQVELPSFSREQPFLKGFLARWGLRLEAIAREEYKSAAAAFTDEGHTPTSTKGSRWLRACFEQAVAQIGAARGLSQAQVARLARRGLLSSDEATRAKLLDGTLYHDEAEELAKREAGTTAAAVPLARYHDQP